jgi:ribosome modulation factor
MDDDAFSMGYNAYYRGKSLDDDNPFDPDVSEAEDWEDGWLAASSDDEWQLLDEEID